MRLSNAARSPCYLVYSLISVPEGGAEKWELLVRDQMEIMKTSFSVLMMMMRGKRHLWRVSRVSQMLNCGNWEGNGTCFFFVLPGTLFIKHVCYVDGEAVILGWCRGFIALCSTTTSCLFPVSSQQKITNINQPVGLTHQQPGCALLSSKVYFMYKLVLQLIHFLMTDLNDNSFI